MNVNEFNQPFRSALPFNSVWLTISHPKPETMGGQNNQNHIVESHFIRLPCSRDNFVLHRMSLRSVQRYKHLVDGAAPPAVEGEHAHIRSKPTG